jgi:hypothetical protein
MFAWSTSDGFVGKGKDPEVANFLFLTGDAFRTLGLSAWRGRLIGSADEHACPETVAKVSYAYWQTKLGGQPIDANTKLLVDVLQLQIVGVTPPSFFGLSVGERFDIARPLCQPKELDRNWFDVGVVGRLRPGWVCSPWLGERQGFCRRCEDQKWMR